jgi:transposase
MAELRVALDIGSDRHRVGIGTADGKIVEEFEITHNREGFELFFSRITVHEKHLNLPVVVAMEGLGGWARPLDQMILQKGYPLLNVNNVKLARFKEIFPAPAKSDKIDTRKILELMHMREVLPLAKAVLHRVGETPVENQQLKRFTRRRRQLVEDKVRVANRLHGDLQAVSPGLLEITGEVDTIWFLNLLTCRDDLTKLAGIKPASVLKIAGVERSIRPESRRGRSTPRSPPRPRGSERWSSPTHTVCSTSSGKFRRWIDGSRRSPRARRSPPGYAPSSASARPVQPRSLERSAPSTGSAPRPA